MIPRRLRACSSYKPHVVRLNCLTGSKSKKKQKHFLTRTRTSKQKEY
jgi:hypothetical protein